jgi:AcrR family transcriptional regulator
MSKKRDQLVEAALELFNQDGFHATGIDKVLAAAGVAKMTMYKHFRSKEELILAVLRLRDERWRNAFMLGVEKRAKGAGDRLLAMFDELGQWFADPGFCGCMFINASAEYADHGDPIHAASAEHKRLVDKYVRDLAEQAGASDPGVLAMQLCLLMEGAVVLTQVCPDGDGGCAAASAKDAARVLIDYALESQVAVN